MTSNIKPYMVEFTEILYRRFRVGYRSMQCE